MLRKAFEFFNGTIFYKKLRRYVDDINIIWRNKRDFNAAFSAIKREYAKTGPALNRKKKRSIWYMVFLYGAETWTLSRTDAASLGVFERKVQRKIFGPDRVGDNYNIRAM